jgi:hypothetical protein
MPTKKIVQNSGLHKFDWPLNGKLRTDVDPMLVGETNFQQLTNMCYTNDFPKSIKGMTKINTQPFNYTSVDGGFHFVKDQPTGTLESHIFAQTTDAGGAVSEIVKSDNTVAVPNQDTFSTFPIALSTTNKVRYSNAPRGAMCAFDGVNNNIWGGNEYEVGQFIVFDPGGSFWYDYTDQVKNTLSDAANIAKMPGVGGGIDASAKAVWHFDGDLTDDSGNSHTLTAVAGNYEAGRFVNAISFDGATEYLRIADHADFDLSGNIYTVDGVFHITSLATINPIYYQRTTADADSFSIYVDTDGSVKVVVKKTGQATFTATTAAGVIKAGTATHIEVDQASTVLYIFVNGTLHFQGTAPLYIQNYTGNVQIGYNNVVYYGGWIDELRISNTTRHTTSFSVPLIAYSAAASVTHVYVASTMKLQGVTPYVGTANGNAAVATGFEWTGTAWSSLTLTDGSAVVAGKTLSGTGKISFPSTVSTSKARVIKNTFAYFYHFVFTGVDTATTIYHVTVDAAMQPVTDIWDGNDRVIASFFKYTSTYIDYTTHVYAQDYVSTDTTSYIDMGGLTTSQCAWVGFLERVTAIGFNLPDAGSINTTPNTVIKIEYWNGSALVAVSGVDDGTSSGGISMHQSAVVSFQAQDENIEFQTNVSNNTQYYYYKITFSQNLSATVRWDYIYGIPVQAKILPHRFSIMWQQRLWLCDEVNNQRNSMLPSNYGTNCVFNGNDTQVREFGDNSRVIAAETLFSRYSSNIYDSLVTFKKTAVYLTDGVSPTTWTTYTVSDTIGLVAEGTLQKCDISFEIAQGITKHVLLWRSDRGIEFYDGNTLDPSISDDIRDFFDPSTREYIDPTIYDVSLETSFYDSKSFRYHWIFTNIDGKQEWVSDVEKKKWSNIDRGAKALTCGFGVQDVNGTKYNYGGTSDGYLERLENGITFDGQPLTWTLFLGDVLLTKSMMYVTRIRHIKLTTKQKTNNSVTITHYADGNTASDYSRTSSMANSTSRLCQIKDSVGVKEMESVLHSFKLTGTNNGETPAFEPLLLSGLFESVREDL